VIFLVTPQLAAMVDSMNMAPTTPITIRLILIAPSPVEPPAWLGRFCCRSLYSTALAMAIGSKAVDFI
jgi:hypothetical protein